MYEKTKEKYINREREKKNYEKEKEGENKTVDIKVR